MVRETLKTEPSELDYPPWVAKQERHTLQLPGGSRTEPKMVTPRERREKRRETKIWRALFVLLGMAARWDTQHTGQTE